MKKGEGFEGITTQVKGNASDLASMVIDGTRRLQLATATISRLTLEVFRLTQLLALKDLELQRARARVEKLENRERRFIRELIAEMTLTAELTEKIEADESEVSGD